MNPINLNYTPVTAEHLEQFERHYSMYGSYAAIGEFVVSIDALKGAVICKRGTYDSDYIFQGKTSFIVADADNTKLREAISMFNAFAHWLQQNKKVQIVQEEKEKEKDDESEDESEAVRMMRVKMLRVRTMKKETPEE